MNYFRRHWYQIGFLAAILFSIILGIWHRQLSDLRLLLSVSLITLFVHQFEEYQLPGYFPRMVNTAMFKSKRPDRYPLNTNTAVIINVWLGWSLYLLAIIFAQNAVWLAIATITISAGNVMAHTFLFNIKGKTLYNPGLFTSLVFFLPITIYFFMFLHRHNLIHPATLTVGIGLGLFINYCGIFKLITVLSKKQTAYIFKPLR